MDREFQRNSALFVIGPPKTPSKTEVNDSSLVRNASTSAVGV